MLYPDTIALIYDNQQLTYQQLNKRANQLAHYLQSLGVKPEVLVGICVERSLDMIVGILGILKAGGAYVPLDPEYPQDRLTFMLEDTQLSVCFSLEGYFIGLGHAYTARNVTLAAIAVAFVPADIAALQFHSNHFLWLTVCLFMLTRMLGFAVKVPSTFESDIGDGSPSLVAHELFEEEPLKQVRQD